MAAAKRILWLGAWFGSSELLRNRAISPAANRWQRDLADGIIGQGFTLGRLGHEPWRVWPYGPLRIRSRTEKGNGLTTTLLGYWNLPRLREVSLQRAYRHAAVVTGREGWEIALAYNLRKPNAVAGRILAGSGCSFVPILADQDDLIPFWPEYERRARGAAGHIFLSDLLFRECRLSPKLHLDGGVLLDPHGMKPWSGSRVDRFRIVFSGTLGSWSGGDLLFKAFTELQGAEWELVLTGRVDGPGLAAIQKDRRIRYLGMLEEDALREVCLSADAFVNPRDPLLPENQVNFPSKILEYLAWGRPVVSTWTLGLAPEYREILQVVDPASPHGMAEAFRALRSWSGPDRDRYRDRLGKFLQTKQWGTQASGLGEWLRTKVRGGGR